MHWPVFTNDWGTICSVVGLALTIIALFKPAVIEWIRAQPRLASISMSKRFATDRANKLASRAKDIGRAYSDNLRFSVVLHILTTKYIKAIGVLGLSFLVDFVNVVQNIYLPGNLSGLSPIHDFHYDGLLMVGLAIQIYGVILLSDYRRARNDMETPGSQIKIIYGEATKIEKKGASAFAINALKTNCLNTLVVLKNRGLVTMNFEIHR